MRSVLKLLAACSSDPDVQQMEKLQGMAYEICEAWQDWL
jgi:hypothetical protein